MEFLPFNNSLSSLDSSTVKDVVKTAAVTSGKRKQSSEEEQGIYSNLVATDGLLSLHMSDTP